MSKLWKNVNTQCAEQGQITNVHSSIQKSKYLKKNLLEQISKNNPSSNGNISKLLILSKQLNLEIPYLGIKYEESTCCYRKQQL